MGGVKRKPRKGEGTVGDLARYVPSAIKVDHTRNFSRSIAGPTPPELQPYLGDKCCFTLAEVEERLASLKKRGQTHPVGVYLTATCEAHLVYGYLRHAAMLLAEVRGELDQIPNAAQKLRCDIVSEPKSQADWLALADINHSENTERKDLTPVDKAEYAQRLLSPTAEGGFGLTREATWERLGLTDGRQLDRYLQLLKQPPDVIAKVHRGELKMAAALKKATQEGRGGSPGPRRGLSSKTMRRALAEPESAPLAVLDRNELLALAGVVVGTVDLADAPESAQAWARWLSTPPAAPPKPGKPKREAPPKLGAPASQSSGERTE